MNAHGFIDIDAVAATHHGDHGQRAISAGAQYESIPFGQGLRRYLQTSEAIAFMRIGAGHVKRDVVVSSSQGRGKAGRNRFEECVIAGVVRQCDIERAALLVEREVVGAVHRKSEDLRVVTKYGRGAVSLVDIAIEYNGGAYQTRLAQTLNGHGNIVEDAITFTAIGVSVVRSAGQVDGETIAKRRVRGRERSAHRPAGAFYHRARPRKTNAPLLLCAKRTRKHALHVIAGVHRAELRFGGRAGFNQLVRWHDAGADHALAQPRIFGHWKTMTRRQRQHELIGVENFHAPKKLKLIA